VEGDVGVDGWHCQHITAAEEEAGVQVPRGVGKVGENLVKELGDICDPGWAGPVSRLKVRSSRARWVPEKGVPGVSEFPKPKFMFENIEVDMCEAQFVVRLDCNLKCFALLLCIF
jgi:hypothetical protein